MSNTEDESRTSPLALECAVKMRIFCPATKRMGERERKGAGKHRKMNVENPETLNLMIDRSREEVATAMIPNNPYRPILTNGRRRRAYGPTALSRRGQIMRTRRADRAIDRLESYRDGLPRRGDTLFKIFFILPFRRMCFFQPEPKQPPACVSEVKGRVRLSGGLNKRKKKRKNTNSTDESVIDEKFIKFIESD